MALITAAVGGGNWTVGATWVGGIAPTAADDALLTSASGNVTIDAGAVCRSLDCNTYTGTLTHTSGVTLTIGDGTAGTGNRALRLVAGMTYTKGNVTTSAMSFVSTSATVQTITTGTKNLGNVTLNGVAGSWQFADAYTSGAGATITFTNGTFNTNNQTCSLGGIVSLNSNTRTLTLGSSTITCSNATASTVFAFTGTGLTITANTATINITANSADFDEGTTNWNGASLVITGAGTVSFRGTSTWANITRTSTVPGVDDALSIAGNKTITGTFTLKGSSTKFRMRLASNQSQSLVSTRTITAAAIDFEYVNLIDIAGAGAANWDISAITGLSGDGGGNSGITFTPAVTQYWFGTTGNWTDATKWFLGTGGTGGAGRVPLIQDTAIFDANSFVAAGNTVTVDFANIGPTNWTGSLPGQTFTWSQNIRCYGSMILVASTTLSSAFGITFVGRAANTLSTFGNIFQGSVTISAVSNSMTLQSDLAVASTRTFTIFVGTFNANGFNVTAGIIDSTGTSVRTVTMGSGTWTASGTGTVWNFITVTNLTYNVGTSTVIISDTSASSKTIAAPSSPAAFYNLTITPGGSGAIIWSGTVSRAINILTITGPKTIQWAANGTYVIASWNVYGSSGNNVVFNSTIPGTRYTFSKASGLVDVRYVTLQDSLASGGAYFQATNSTDSGNNSGWNFFTASAGGGLQAGKKFAAFGGARPINKVLDSKLHGYRKLGG